jgi:hypothetical protein
MNRGTGLASQNRYFAWGSELRPWPGELEYLAGARLHETVKWNTLVNSVTRQNGLTFNDRRISDA